MLWQPGKSVACLQDEWWDASPWFTPPDASLAAAKLVLAARPAPCCFLAAPEQAGCRCGCIICEVACRCKGTFCESGSSERTSRCALQSSTDR